MLINKLYIQIIDNDEFGTNGGTLYQFTYSGKILQLRITDQDFEKKLLEFKTINYTLP